MHQYVLHDLLSVMEESTTWVRRQRPLSHRLNLLRLLRLLLLNWLLAVLALELLWGQVRIELLVATATTSWLSELVERELIR